MTNFDKEILQNLLNIETGKRLIKDIVQLDRLPKENTLEGLQLIRRAWCQHDVCVHLARSNKFWCKFLFLMQLLVGWLLVFVGVQDFMEPEVTKHVLIVLSSLTSLLISIVSGD